MKILFNIVVFCWVVSLDYVQVATGAGTMSHYFNLHIVVPEAFILGSGEYHIGEGSTISLVCIIENLYNNNSSIKNRNSRCVFPAKFYEVSKQYKDTQKYDKNPEEPLSTNSENPCTVEALASLTSGFAEKRDD
ncbi:hypothetical protein B566_EDAN000778 [Ephemera danica]|nr:hypothetical protein B566_EDAN000778 [Ephemera danica]